MPPGTTYKVYCSRRCRLKAKRGREKAIALNGKPATQVPGVAHDITFPSPFQLDQSAEFLRTHRDQIIILRGILPPWEKPADIMLTPQPDGSQLMTMNWEVDLTGIVEVSR